MEVDQGNCSDSVTVYYGLGPETFLIDSTKVDQSMTIKGLEVKRAGLYMSDTNVMDVRFKSCYRNVGITGVWKKKFGLKAQIEFQSKLISHYRKN